MLKLTYKRLFITPKLSRPLQSKSFCDKKPKEQSDPPKQDAKDQGNTYLKQMIDFITNMKSETFGKAFADIEKQVKNKKFKLKSIPDPNSFGEAMIYLSPHKLHSVANRTRLEATSLPFIYCLSVLSFLGAFGMGFIHYYTYALFLSAIMRYHYNRTIKFIYQINLINESEVKVIYTNGEIRVVKIKDIRVSELFDFSSVNLPYRKEIYLIIGGKETAKLAFNVYYKICFVDLNILLAIINKKVEQLTTEESEESEEKL